MDIKLIKQAKKGNKDAFASLIESVRSEAYKVAYCYLSNEHDSMDAVCSAVEKSFYSIKKIKKPEYFKTWFIRVVINECKMQIRKEKRVVNFQKDLEDEESFPTYSSDIMDLKLSLKKLPELERTLIYLKYVMGYTLNEISDIVGIPEGTVKTKIYSNLKKLREILEVREA